MLTVGRSSTNGHDGCETGQINGHLDGKVKDLDTKSYDAPTTPQKMTLRQSQFPPTPESTPSRGTNRIFSTALEPYPASPSRKRGGQQTLTAFRTLPPSPKKTHYRCKRTPQFSILYEPEKKTLPKVSAIELKRVAESVLSQVSWEEVGEDVASNRYGAFYRKIIRGILQEKLDQLYLQESRLEEEENKAVKVGGGSRDRVQDREGSIEGK